MSYPTTLSAIDYLEQHPEIKKYIYNGGDPITKEFESNTTQSFGDIMSRAIILCNYARIKLEWPILSETDPYNEREPILFAHVHPLLEEVRMYNNEQLRELLRAVVSNTVLLASLNLPKLTNQPDVNADDYETINSGIITGIIRYNFETEETYENYKLILAEQKAEKKPIQVADVSIEDEPLV